MKYLILLLLVPLAGWGQSFDFECATCDTDADFQLACTTNASLTTQVASLTTELSSVQAELDALKAQIAAQVVLEITDDPDHCWDGEGFNRSLTLNTNLSSSNWTFSFYYRDSIEWVWLGDAIFSGFLKNSEINYNQTFSNNVFSFNDQIGHQVMVYASQSGVTTERYIAVSTGVADCE